MLRCRSSWRSSSRLKRISSRSPAPLACMATLLALGTSARGSSRAGAVLPAPVAAAASSVAGAVLPAACSAAVSGCPWCSWDAGLPAIVTVTTCDIPSVAWCGAARFPARLLQSHTERTPAAAAIAATTTNVATLLCCTTIVFAMSVASAASTIVRHANAVTSPSRRRSGICLTKDSSLSEACAFVPMSAQFKSVSMVPSSNSLFLSASCTHNSLMAKCLTLPEPVREHIPLAAELSDPIVSRPFMPICSRIWLVCFPMAAARTMP